MATNDYYAVEQAPRPRQRARAEVVSGELQRIERGFDRLPAKNVLAGSAHLLAVEIAASAANVYVLESEYAFNALVIGTTVRFFVTNTNNGASTVNVDDTGVKDLKDIDGTDLPDTALVAGWLAEIVWNGAHWRLLNSAKQATASIALSEALAPQNYQRNVAIADLVLPAATGGTSPYTYAATGLPAGLAYDPLTRTISGTPTTISTSSVTYTVTDANSNTFTYEFQIRVVAALIALPDPQDRTLTVGSDYGFVLLAATGGTAPYGYSIEGLPDGLLFDAEIREVTGSPSSESIGVNTVTLSVADSGNPRQTLSQDFDLTVRSAASLSLQGVENRTLSPDSAIDPFILPAAHGGVPDYTYILTGLGEGLMFDSTSREISGTPSVTGEREVHYRVQDSIGTQVEQTFTINIQPLGARYVAVAEDRDISATEITSGNSFGVAEQSLTLPAWLGNRYIVIAQPATQPDLTSISLAGLGNSFSDFEKQSYTRDVNGASYEIWVGLEVQGEVISGEVIEVRP